MIQGLWNLSRNAENQVKIAEAGGIEAILEGMGRHKEHAGVKELGCVGLWNLSGNAENQVKIAEAGGIEAIVEVLSSLVLIKTPAA